MLDWYRSQSVRCGVAGSAVRACAAVAVRAEDLRL